ncbi:MAG: prolyl oligopeptidase family serine peptidase [Bacteroidales bacterium]
MEETVSEADAASYTVYARKHTDCMDLPENMAAGERTVVHAYVSDEAGRPVASGTHVTLVLSVGPRDPVSNPFQYTRSETCRGNVWTEYRLLVSQKGTGTVWDTESGRYSEELARFDLTGRFKASDGIEMSFAFHKPARQQNVPLIIWLHGGGEGGTDPSIPLLANKAANYASPEIQTAFGGAYVLVPQCPGAWMHNAQGVMTHGEDDVYHGALMELIEDFVSKHPDIDRNRIYVGGCSNGGYMSMKLILEHPTYFAAGYISALAFQSQYISDKQMKKIAHVPIWFVHAADDQTTIPNETVLPVYDRLKALGAPVHLSYYEHVVDLTGMYGGNEYHHTGHWSWVYSHANACYLDKDGSAVTVDGKPVHIMEWMASQKKK